jgi:hypothetical protein
LFSFGGEETLCERSTAGRGEEGKLRSGFGGEAVGVLGERTRRIGRSEGAEVEYSSDGQSGAHLGGCGRGEVRLINVEARANALWRRQASTIILRQKQQHAHAFRRHQFTPHASITASPGHLLFCILIHF